MLPNPTQAATKATNPAIFPITGHLHNSRTNRNLLPQIPGTLHPNPVALDPTVAFVSCVVTKGTQPRDAPLTISLQLVRIKGSRALIPAPNGNHVHTLLHQTRQPLIGFWTPVLHTMLLLIYRICPCTLRTLAPMI